MTLTVGVDFDGTVVEHMYPKLGSDAPGAAETLKALTNAGGRVILWTMRDGDELDQAVKWFKDREIPLYGVNRNPGQSSWTTSPKAYCHVYIDDCGILIPTVPGGASNRPVVDWSIVGPALLKMARSVGLSVRLP